MVEAMEQLGHVHFALAGHDRGGRVSYRLALDHPGRLSKLAVLDILPTYDYWEKMNRLYALNIYHWTFLAQPHPLPETLIAGNGEFFLRQKMASQTKSKTLDAMDPRALQHYIAPFLDPSRIHAMCEDYRAGAYADYDIDKADFDAGRKITIPMKTSTMNRSSRNRMMGHVPMTGNAKPWMNSSKMASMTVMPRIRKPPNTNTWAMPGTLHLSSFFCPRTSVTSASSRVAGSLVRSTAG